MAHFVLEQQERGRVGPSASGDEVFDVLLETVRQLFHEVGERVLRLRGEV